MVLKRKWEYINIICKCVLSLPNTIWVGVCEAQPFGDSNTSSEGTCFYLGCSLFTVATKGLSGSPTKHIEYNPGADWNPGWSMQLFFPIQYPAIPKLQWGWCLIGFDWYVLAVQSWHFLSVKGAWMSAGCLGVFDANQWNFCLFHPCEAFHICRLYLLLVLSLYIRLMYSNPNKTTFTGNCIAKTFSPWSDQKRSPTLLPWTSNRGLFTANHWQKNVQQTYTRPKTSGWSPKMEIWKICFLF